MTWARFEVGKTYSRREISHALGGSIRAHLPTKDGLVVCGCFKREPRWNPGAPAEVTFGKAGGIVQANAEWVSKQTGPIPIFLFRADNAGEYVGLYRCSGYTTDPAVLRRKMEENPARGGIAGVIYFKRVGE
jgi:hypothetical protein